VSVHRVGIKQEKVRSCAARYRLRALRMETNAKKRCCSKSKHSNHSWSCVLLWQLRKKGGWQRESGSKHVRFRIIKSSA